MKEPVVELKKEHQLIQPLFLAEGLLEMLLALLEVMLCVERVLDMSPLETTLNKVRTNLEEQDRTRQLDISAGYVDDKKATITTRVIINRPIVAGAAL